MSTENRTEVIGAFDLGSNTIKMTLGRRDEARGVEEFLWRSETIRLGRDLERTGELAPDRIEAALDTLQRFAGEARAAGATRLIGVATEATRSARNGAAFLSRVREKTGIEIRPISGAEEAELTFRGLEGEVDLGGRVAVADIGGASTELIVSVDRALVWSHSYRLGSGTLTDRHVRADPPLADELARCRADAVATVDTAPLDRVTAGRLIVVGGTGEYLDRLLAPGELRLPETLDVVLARLQAIASAELSIQLRIAEARARVLPAGVAIAAGIADCMSPVSFAAAPSGIRRGLLLAALAGDR